MPELVVLVKGMGAAMRSMLVTLCILFLIIYIFAIVFVQTARGTKAAAGHFDNIPQAMNFMLVQVLTGFDDTFMLDLLQDGGLVVYMLWLAYIFLGALTIMNMLIGVLCEVMASTAEKESENRIVSDMENHVGLFYQDHCCMITRDKMMHLLEHPETVDRLQDLGVDVGAFLDFANFVYNDTRDMAISDFVEMVVQFQGSKAATVKDIVDLRKFFSMEMAVLEARILSQEPVRARKLSQGSASSLILPA